MNRGVLIVTALAGAAIASTIGLESAEADSGKATVTAIVEGVDSANDRGVVYVTGAKVKKFKVFALSDARGADAGALELIAKSSTELTLGLPPGLAPGRYTLSLAPRKGEPCEVPFTYRRSFAPLDAIGGLELTPDVSGFDDFAMRSTSEQFNRILLENTGDPMLTEQLFAGFVARSHGQEYFAGTCRTPFYTGWEIFDNVAQASRVFIADGTGNVGIGTSFLITALDVAGTARVAGTGSFNVNTNLGGSDGEVLLGWWEGANDDAPQMRFQTQPTFDFIDIGMNSTGDFVVENRFDADMLTLTQSGSMTIPGVATAAAHVSTSDARLKKDIVPVSDVLPKLASVTTVRYRMKEGAQRLRIGVLAQDVEQEFPELVYEREDGFKAVSYGELSSVLLQAVKEQQSQIEDQNAEIRRLRAELSTLASVVGELAATVEAGARDTDAPAAATEAR